uniref:Endonuclease/exonuclease/phosphatase domain-containing protein n=1 Tax=Timema douglasi TaxID=61478 RepID=A0A7R8Z4Z5_TIMDO|nr:unnamed protein product [Timema douglasi]
MTQDKGGEVDLKTWIFFRLDVHSKKSEQKRESSAQEEVKIRDLTRSVSATLRTNSLLARDKENGKFSDNNPDPLLQLTTDTWADHSGTNETTNPSLSHETRRPSYPDSSARDNLERATPQGTRKEGVMASVSDGEIDVEGTDDEAMEDQEGSPSNTETDIAFEPVSGLKRKFKTRPEQEVLKTKAIKVNNKFASLSSLQDEPSNSQTGQPSGGTNVSSTPRRIKTPPVVITNATKYNMVIKLLNTSLQDDYKVYCIAQGIKVVTTSYRDYTALLKLLKQNTLEHFTYVLPKDKPFKAVIKGLHASMPCAEIKEELEDRGFTPTDTKEGESKVASPPSRMAGYLKPPTVQQLSASQPTLSTNKGLNQPSYSGAVKKMAKKDKKEERDLDESFDLKDILQIIKDINIVGILQLLRKYLGRGEEVSLNILFWNANGILQQEYEFRKLLYTYGVDIALICETHLAEQKKMRFSGYEMYRNDRTTGRGGGTAVLVRSSLAHYQTCLPAMNYIESTSIVIPTGRKQIVFTAVYRSPAVPFTIEDLDKLTSRKDFLIAGDINCKHTSWNSRVSNQAGRTLAAQAETKNYTVLATNEPTYYPSNYRNLPDVLDIVLTDLDTLPEELETLNELDSDHLPVFGRISLKTNPRLSYLRRKIPRSDWGEYRRVLTDAVPLNMEVNSPEEVDSSITLLTATLLEAYRETTAFETPPVSWRRDDPELSYLIALKREARRKWQQHRDPRHRAEYNRLRALVRRKAKTLKISNWNEYVEDTLAGDGNVWKVTRQLKGTKGKAGTTVIHGRRGLEYRSEAKAEAIAESLEDQFKANSEPQDEEFTRTVKRAVRAYLADPDVELPPPITRNEVAYQVERLKLRKAASHDRISNEMLRHAWGYAPESVIGTLQVVQNKILRSILGVNTRSSNEYIHATTGSATLQEIFRKRGDKLYKRASEVEDNATIRRLGQYDPRETRRYKKPRLV